MSIEYETPQQLRYMLEAALHRLNGTYQIKTDAISQLAEALSQDLFEAEDQSESSTGTENHGYRYLEPKPYKQTKQLGIKGRNMIVWNLVGTMRTEEFGIKETAQGFGIPVEAVIEALDYYYKNRSMIEAENEQIGRELNRIDQGLKL